MVGRSGFGRSVTSRSGLRFLDPKSLWLLDFTHSGKMLLIEVRADYISLSLTPRLSNSCDWVPFVPPAAGKNPAAMVWYFGSSLLRSVKSFF